MFGCKGVVFMFWCDMLFDVIRMIGILVVDEFVVVNFVVVVELVDSYGDIWFVLII